MTEGKSEQADPWAVHESVQFEFRLSAATSTHNAVHLFRLTKTSNPFVTYWEAHIVKYTIERKLNTSYNINVLQELTNGTLMMKFDVVACSC